MMLLPNEFGLKRLNLRDKFGRRVYIVRSGAWNPDKVSYGELYSISYKIAEVMALEPKTQIAGCTIIVDGKVRS